MSTSLLMIEDDLRLAQMVGEYLGQSGMQLAHCPDAASGLARLQGQDGGTLPELVILDLMLPDMDGLEVCRRIRALPGPVAQMPVLMLTAKGDPMDRVIGLEIGADDYLPKPFDLDELEARLHALVRRSDVTQAKSGSNSIQIGAVRYEKESGALYLGDTALELTPRELALVHALLARPGHAVTKERLYELVFPGQLDVQYEAIEVVVYRLRKKLTDTGLTLMTLRGLGYLIKAEGA